VIQTLHRDIRALHDFVAVELPRLAPDVVGTETLQLADVLKSSWEWRAWFAEADSAPHAGVAVRGGAGSCRPAPTGPAGGRRTPPPPRRRWPAAPGPPRS